MRDEHQVRIGAQIARLREAQGWSQRALAKWVGLDQSAVSRIEAGRRRLSAEELERFAGALHVSADVLLMGPETGPAVSFPPPAPAALWSRQASHGIPVRPVDFDAMVPEPAYPATGESSVPAARRLDQTIGGTPDDGLVVEMVAGVEAPARRASPRLAGVPVEATAVARDWFDLRLLAEAEDQGQRWSTGHSAEGKPESAVHSAGTLRPGAAAGDVLYDRVARFWRSELHVDPDDGPLPDLVPLLEEGYGAQVIVARVAAPGDPADAANVAAHHPVAAAFSERGIPFIFVNAARPVVLQRFALAHAFAHHVLGHGDIVDRRVQWSRNVPPEAAANDFAEEFLAPVRAVQRWYERRPARRAPTLEDLLDLGNTFGVSVWSALFRSRAAGRLPGRQFHVLRAEVRTQEWELLPRQAFLGGLCDTLTHLTPEEVLPPGRFGPPAVMRVPAPMRTWALSALRGGRLSLEDAAAMLRLDPAALAGQLRQLGLD